MLRQCLRRISTSVPTSAYRTHAERTAAQQRDNTLHTALITNVIRTTPTLRLFTLTLTPTPAAQNFAFKPGQWLDVHTPTPSSPGGFTIISPPSRLPHIELAIRAAPHNPPAAWLWQDETDVVGKAVGVRVGGSFVFPPPETTRVAHVVFVAAGVGINPLLAMLRHIQEAQKDLEVDFLWSTKAPVAGAYMQFLSSLSEGSFRLFVTGEEGEEEEEEEDEGEEGEGEGEGGKVEWPHERRRMTVEDVAGVVGLGPRDETVVYVCGPPEFSDEFVEGVVAAGLDRERVFVEKWW